MQKKSFKSEFKQSLNLSRVCFLQMHERLRIRWYLTQEVVVLAANALVSSRLDYANSLFRTLSMRRDFYRELDESALSKMAP